MGRASTSRLSAVLLYIWPVYIRLASGASALQPDTGMLRHVFEESLARRQREYGEMDIRTAQAARDLGLFLKRAGDLPASRRALAEAVRIDEKVLGPAASETLADVGDLALILPAAQAAPLFARAVESPDPAVAGPANPTLGRRQKRHFPPGPKSARLPAIVPARPLCYGAR